MARVLILHIATTLSALAITPGQAAGQNNTQASPQGSPERSPQAASTPEKPAQPDLAVDATGHAVPYTALSDRQPRLAATPPQLGPSGFRFTDPEFGSRIVRVTDEATRPDKPGRAYSTPSSSEQNSWNMDSTLFYIEGRGGEIVPYRFDPATMQVSRIGHGPGGGLLVPLRSSPAFSFVDADLLYGFSPDSPPVLQSYRISKDKLRSIHDPGKCVPLGPGVYGRDVTLAGDDSRLGTQLGGPGPDRDMYVYVFDQSQGCRWWNTQTGEIGGRWGPKGTASTDLRLTIHNARISKDGNYMRVTPAVASQVKAVLIWEIGTTNVSVCPTTGGLISCEGHVVLGNGYMVNQRGLKDGVQFALRPLGDLAQVRNLVNPVMEPGEWSQDSHPSWNNARPDVLVPVCMSIYRPDGKAGHRAWDDEVVCVRTDGKESQTWRFAHTHSTNASFDTRPRGNVSPDGRFFMFHSDWLGTLGRDRTDVFIVELK